MKRSHKIYTLAFTLLILLGLKINAQQPTIEWVARYNGQNNDSERPSNILVDNNKNILVVGNISTPDQGSNIILIKYNSSGSILWSAIYNNISNTNESASGLALDSSGNIFVSGHTGFNLGPFDIFTIKYNSNGVFQWAKIFSSPDNAEDFGGIMACDGIGNVYVSGGCGEYGAIFGQGAALLIKYNAIGDSLWVRRYSTTGLRGSFGFIKLDKKGNVYTTGDYDSVYFSPLSYSTHSVTVKYSSNGELLWATKYNNGVNDRTSLIELDNSGNSYVTGYTRIVGGIYKYLTIKYTTTGVQQWVRLYSSPSNSSSNSAVSIAGDNSGNIYVTGKSKRDASTTDLATIKYNSNGDSVWVRRYPDIGSVALSVSMVVDDLFSPYILFNNNSGITLLKYNNIGSQQWVVSYPGNNTGIAIDNMRNLYVIGSNADSGTGLDIITIKYSQIMGIQPVSYEIPKGYELSQNYPNPFNPSTKINFSIPKKSFVQLKIFDMLGREKDEIVKEELVPSEYEVSFNGVGYASSVYFYQLIADGNIIDTKKFILLK